MTNAFLNMEKIIMWNDIGIGIISSVFATILICISRNLYKIDYKSDMFFHLENAYISIYKIQNHHVFLKTIYYQWKV